MSPSRSPRVDAEAVEALLEWLDGCQLDGEDSAMREAARAEIARWRTLMKDAEGILLHVWHSNHGFTVKCDGCAAVFGIITRLKSVPFQLPTKKRRIAMPDENMSGSPTPPEPLSSETAKRIQFHALTETQVKNIEAIREQGSAIAFLVDRLADAAVFSDGPEMRWVAIARTHFQEGQMALVRAVAKPAFF